MHLNSLYSTGLLLLSFLQPSAALIGKHVKVDSKLKYTKRTSFPANITDYLELTNPEGIKIRYKEPGKEGVCETTSGVNSYSGYIDLAPNVHMFFWFFESRRDPANDDLTLWLNGGPGSDSLIGLFSELGPCRITPELESVLNPWSFNNVSNMLFLSQPVGTGFSYQNIANGSLDDPNTGTFLNSSQAPVTGTYPILDPVDVGEIDTTELAAIAAWHTLQAFVTGLPCFSGNTFTTPKNFNLWTESYGGHYGPAFFNYFYKQNEAIAKGKTKGYHMNFRTLGLINAIISEKIQAKYYPDFAVNNTYGIKAYNDTVYNYANFANTMINGCQDQIDYCIQAANGTKGGYVNGRITTKASSNPSIAALCSEAQSMCRDNVEGPYYAYGERGVYDIRHPYDDPTPPTFWAEYLNIAEVQHAVGVSVNYTEANDDIYFQFQQTGDFIYPNFLNELKDIVNSGVRVALMYGDADYICNWFGGQAVSEQLKYKHHKQFLSAGYEPYVYGGVEYGETREYGNFSFTRVYEAGHTIPYYQPQASFGLFERVIGGFDIPTGMELVTSNLTSDGPKTATHTESSIALPPTGTVAGAKWTSSILATYDALDTQFPTTTATAY